MYRKIYRKYNYTTQVNHKLFRNIKRNLIKISLVNFDYFILKK